MLVISLLFALSSASSAVDAYAIQPPGTFHAGEAVARNGETWLALRANSEQSSSKQTRTRLDRVRLRVKRVFDVVIDNEGDATAQEVSSSSDDDVLAFLRGPLLHAGPVMQAEVQDQSQQGLLAQTLRMNNHVYRIDTRCEPLSTRAESGATYRCRIDLVLGKQRQALMKVDGTRSEADGNAYSLGDDAAPALIFAGDLDGDGRLDLIFNTTDHYNVSKPTLFLSGAAGQGELLHAVAANDSVGC